MKLLPSLRRRRLTAVAAGVVTAAVLAGCAGAADPAATPDSAGEPVAGGTLQVASNGDVRPALVLAGNQNNFPWQHNVFETLTAYDEDFVIQPQLATEWEVATDGLSIDITLRDDVTFHSGRPMTAEDVKYSFELTLDPIWGSQLAFISQQFTSIDVVSDTELTIEFAAPLPNVFDFFEQTAIVDQETSEGLADGSQVIGTGPFVWDTWTPGTSLTLTKNENYWGDPAYLDSIEVAIITDTTAMVNALRSGRINYAIGLPGIDVASFEEDPSYRLISVAGLTYPLGLDATAAPFDNIEVRQAVNYAIDRERIVDQVFGGLAEVTTQFWTSNNEGYDPELDAAYEYDPERAAQIIEDAGATGAEVEISVIGFGPPISMAEIVRNNLEEVGLQPTVNVLELVDFLAAQSAADLGPAWVATHGVWFAPATHVKQFPSLRPGNPSKFDTPEYTELVDAVTSASPEDAAEANQALGAYITEQAFSIPLAYAPGYVVATSNLQGESATARGYAVFGQAFLSE